MRLLFADSLAETRLNALRDAGHDVVVNADLGADDLPDAIAGFDVLVVRSTKVSAATIEAADHLGLIVRAGAGTDNVDKAAASAKGVYVCNVPGQNAVAVAELTMALLLAIDRHIADGVADLRGGVWNKKKYTKAAGLYGSTIGIIGLGDIGIAVAERAKAFGLTVVAERKSNRSGTTQQRIRSVGIQLVDNRAELLAQSDIVSIHVPKSADTTGMVDAGFLSEMKDGAILLNTSRGDIVNADDLLAAMDARGLRAGLDVYPGEPASGTGSFESPLAAHPNVVGSHHIGASTEQAQDAVAAGTIEVVEAYLAGDVVNCVNLVDEPLGSCVLGIRHLDEVGVLAKVFAMLRQRGLNIQQMQNQVFTANGAAVATINVEGVADAELVNALEDIHEVLNVRVSGC